MGLNLRKTIVGLTVLVVLLGVYVGYSRWGGDTPSETRAVPLPDPNDLTPISDDQAGKIGDARIGQIKRARLIHQDAAGNVDREFGFEELSHPQGRQWQATHPFMTLYQSSFKCSVTADKGQVQTESNFDRMIPNDATFSGNVVIHIVSSDPNNAGEAFIYLDEVVFTAAKSLFSTSGPVRFVSRVAKLDGRGMELLYDEQRSRLDLFRIQNLYSLRLRSEEFDALDSSRDRSGKSLPVGQESVGGRPERGPESRPAPKAAPAGSPKVPYECVLWKDVRIVMPEEVVIAEDRFSITNILWPGSKAGEPNHTEVGAKGSGSKPKAEPNEPRNPIDPRNNAPDAAPSSALTLDSLPESLFDVVVTCKGGLVIRPMGATSPDNAALKGADSGEPAGLQATDDPSRHVIAARYIDVNASTSNAILAGPVRMVLQIDPNKLPGAQRDGRKIPLTVTAQKDVRYLSDSNQIVLDGDCVATAQMAEPNATMECKLTSPKLTLDLIDDPNAAKKSAAARGRTRGSSVDLKRATASGGFKLQMLRKTALETTGDFYLEGTQFDYDAQRNNLVAIGPGQVILHNSQDADGKEDSNNMSLREPCWAFLKKFDRLTYSEASNRIVAESRLKQLQVDYFTLVKGHPDRYDQYVQADVGQIEIELAKVADNRMELATLTASDGVAFREGTKQFDGSTLFYDQRKGTMIIRGDEGRPCYLNGALVDGIEINVKTGQAKTIVISSSTVSTK
jgi:hypothetical protein